MPPPTLGTAAVSGGASRDERRTTKALQRRDQKEAREAVRLAKAEAKVADKLAETVDEEEAEEPVIDLESMPPPDAASRSRAAQRVHRQLDQDVVKMAAAAIELEESESEAPDFEYSAQDTFVLDDAAEVFDRPGASGLVRESRPGREANWGAIAGVFGLVSLGLSVILALGALLVALGVTAGGVFEAILNAFVGPLTHFFEFSGAGAERKEHFLTWGAGSVGYLLISFVGQAIQRAKSDDG